MRRVSLGLAALLLPLTACSPGPDAADPDMNIYATTGYLADAVANIAPDAEVTTMVGPDGDPHTYQPTTRDVDKLRSADLVFSNGLHLEAQMETQLEALGDKHRAVAEQLPSQMLLPWEDTDAEGNALHDPHVWNSPDAWMLVIDDITATLAAHDPDNAETYRSHAASYQEEISAAVERAHATMAEVTTPRILITGHDAFAYFGQTFNLEVLATDYISTEAALSPTELSALADYIAENKVPVIFRDNQANPQAITSLREAVTARGWDVAVSDAELFADSLGPEAPQNTYLGAFEHNVATVAAALS
ncbi:MAG: zinc ABC transporter substrate-binding protein [Corynebacterium sp.]|uniref:metal ABC transporter substrate-binding protein n=1 Tax=Corynebacterium sp. TaxID=1720 RepID=UPI0026DF84B7|nr:zinc ABC transporter substrate-binding protein [Corynebacterium sp.]MDO5669881.1 zinc ABC transporter substrate-binding protein [Corynebacterium sp.]